MNDTIKGERIELLSPAQVREIQTHLEALRTASHELHHVPDALDHLVRMMVSFGTSTIIDGYWNFYQVRGFSFPVMVAALDGDSLNITVD